MTERLVLDEIVNPYSARVLVERGAQGWVRSARFDLAGMPRVESLLVGRLAADVPGLVERLCGVCPAAHHLAGVRALESLAGEGELPPAAVLARRLLHHASAVSTHATRFVTSDRESALALRGLAKAVSAAVGSPRHFPATAVPGGIACQVSSQGLEAVRALLPRALQAAHDVAERELARNRVAERELARNRVAERELARTGSPWRFKGADVALVDDQGRPDLLGTRLRAVADDGSVLIAAAGPQDWGSLVTEQRPGDPAPRPRLTINGHADGLYRVGPVAQLRIGELGTPMAARLQRRWRSTGAGAMAARAVMAVHSVEVIAEILDRTELLDERFVTDVAGPTAGSEGVGWVDGPRGLLVHHYRVGPEGRLQWAQILTPTAQNEPWLAGLLTAVVRGSHGGSEQEHLAMEDAIREADPCLPCVMAPAGAMGLVIEESVAGDSGTGVDRPPVRGR